MALARSAIVAIQTILFIGNSLTYFNEMPWMTEQVAKSLNTPVATRFAGFSGRTLEQQWKDPKVLAAIRESHANYVILQPQSTEVVRDYDNTLRYARLLAAEARNAGAKPVVFMTWKTRDNASPQSEHTRRAIDLAKALDADLAPVGLAWEYLTKNGIDLFEDDVHPNVAGSYLEACVVYAVVTGKDPAGATHTFETHYTIPEFYRRSLEQDKIDAVTAEEIQRVAWAAVRAARR